MARVRGARNRGVKWSELPVGHWLAAARGEPLGSGTAVPSTEGQQGLQGGHQNSHASRPASPAGLGCGTWDFMTRPWMNLGWSGAGAML